MYGTQHYSSNIDTKIKLGGVPYNGWFIDIIVLCYDGFIITCLNVNGLLPQIQQALRLKSMSLPL